MFNLQFWLDGPIILSAEVKRCTYKIAIIYKIAHEIAIIFTPRFTSVLRMTRASSQNVGKAAIWQLNDCCYVAMAQNILVFYVSYKGSMRLFRTLFLTNEITVFVTSRFYSATENNVISSLYLLLFLIFVILVAVTFL